MTATAGRPVRARLVARDNRFVARARLPDGGEARAYVPNTGRLEDLLVPGATVLLEPTDAPARVTRWTLTRVWDGAWVALDTARPPALLADHLATGAGLGPWPPAAAVRREVRHGHHRFDLELDLVDGRRAVVEVKSLTTARDGVAPLSSTPSRRGAAHLAELAAMARAGATVAVALVVQRQDVTEIDLDAPAAEPWVAAVRAAHDAGVLVLGFSCAVEEVGQRLDRELPVRGLAPGPTAR
jgi:sugar fermentation stimulation protein A